MSATSNPRIERFQKMVAAYPDAPEPRFSLGCAYQDAGDHAAAVAEFERCLAARPDWAACLIALADACVELGEKERAAQALREARVHAFKQGHSSMAAEAEEKLEDLGLALE